jgi:tRNA A-37 threonylcarbamoyl transferase component Bud32
MACLSRAQLEALAQGSAKTDHARELSRHVDECAACREKLRELSRPAPASPEVESTSATVCLAGGDGMPDSSAHVTLTRPPDLETDFPAPPRMLIRGYEIIKELHRGGQGIVYQAMQRSTGRKVAIKVVREGPFASRTERARFEREVEILAHLRHPNIVTIYDGGETAGQAYFVMDYISGHSLDQWLSKNKPPIRERVILFSKIADAVAAAHQQGITHRDLKPGNIRVDEDGEPHILDFGLAKAADSLDVSQMTRTGQFMGSLPWASPEQAEAVPEKVDIRTDVYSLGVMLYEALTGQFPYNVLGNMRDVLDRIMNAEPQRPSALCSEIDRELETIVLKCLQKPRERRYQNGGELAHDIRRYLAGEPILARGDSVVYMVWTRGRRSVRRHSLTATLAGLVLIGLAWCLLDPLVYRWTPVNEWFLRVLAGLVPAGTPSDFEQVRVIALTDHTDVAALAQAAGLTDVGTDNLRSLRRLHGALMGRLANSGLKALAWDICFETPSEFDGDLARGIRAVRQAGRDVILSTKAWHIGGAEPSAPSTLEGARWAATTGDYSAERPWALDLVVERPGATPVACLALAAVNSAFRPDTEVHLEIDSASQKLASRYWNTGRGEPSYGYHVQLTGRWSLTQDYPALGLRRDDVVGQYVIAIPSDEALVRCTLDYEDVFMAGQEQLRSWLAQQIVVVADLRTGIDRHPYPDGRSVGGAYAHAAAIDGMLRRSGVRASTGGEERMIISLAVLAGAVAALFLHRSIPRMAALMVIALVLATGAGVAAYRQCAYLENPTIPVLALLTSLGFVTSMRRQARARRGTFQVEEKSR